MDKKEKSQPPVALNMNPQLNTHWIDSISLAAREDNLFLIRFLTSLPEGIYEQTRIMTSKEHLIKFADVLCTSLDYYPTKKKK